MDIPEWFVPGDTGRLGRLGRLYDRGIEREGGVDLGVGVLGMPLGHFGEAVVEEVGEHHHLVGEQVVLGLVALESHQHLEGTLSLASLVEPLGQTEEEGGGVLLQTLLLSEEHDDHACLLERVFVQKSDETLQLSREHVA